jgi:hypothetical protein
MDSADLFGSQYDEQHRSMGRSWMFESTYQAVMPRTNIWRYTLAHKSGLSARQRPSDGSTSCKRIFSRQTWARSLTWRTVIFALLKNCYTSRLPYWAPKLKRTAWNTADHSHSDSLMMPSVQKMKEDLSSVQPVLSTVGKYTEQDSFLSKISDWLTSVNERINERCHDRKKLTACDQFLC